MCTLIPVPGLVPMVTGPEVPKSDCMGSFLGNLETGSEKEQTVSLPA